MREHRRKHLTESHRKKFSEMYSGEGNPNFGKSHSAESRAKISLVHKGKKLSNEHRYKIGKSLLGRFVGERSPGWKGGISPQPYCKLWIPDLKQRIRARWNYKSAWSGKTKDDNKGRCLCCHHVYYHKKACCEWDEENGQFFAWIEGTKFYITGDPNKFVTLTYQEHSIVGHNRLYWAQKFEDLILDEGDKSYLTKDEMALNRVVNGIV